MLLYLGKYALLALGFVGIVVAIIGFLVMFWVYVLLRTRGAAEKERTVGSWGLYCWLGGGVVWIPFLLGSYWCQDRHDQQYIDAAQALLQECQRRGDAEPVPTPNKALVLNEKELLNKANEALPSHLQAEWFGDKLLFVVGTQRSMKKPPAQLVDVVDVSVIRWPQKEAIGTYMVEVKYPNEKAIGRWIQDLPARSRGDGPALREAQRREEKKP
jgi:hypothetical protein